MSSNNDTTQGYSGYSNLPMDQTGNNVGMSNTDLNINTAIPASQNATFEFYVPSPNGTRIYHVVYQFTELDPLENARILNNTINLSHIPGYQFPHNYYIRPLIQQQIQQQVQQPVVYQQNVIQQSFDTMNTQPISQVYLDNNNVDNTSSNGVISDDMQDMRFQNS
ncbi:hypothetical protein C1645_740489 [Glomus cerebriforme]|uniref:Uncharacterized protein n=1 Tax=Glomus cerebriforme TaxID=658196 RepID=A0A397SQQ4_9GLOM|nr:hypothetical protein C1645_740489 [Glomus cerebriforme]